ncbi:MFS transporter [uncultured Enterobacter sp.]|uniref:MFS transporter n=1 Tax=uncultured Enterobacter sp. TaxID=238202 RepID=UPI0025D7521E|nr:MFS transporter [uncultured Enterobacter sp.]
MKLNRIFRGATRNELQQIATRLIFFLSGMGMSAWAPLIPFVKDNTGVNDSMLGLLLFCIGAGSMLVMPYSGYIIGRLGCRMVILAAGFFLCIDLVFLIFFSSALCLAFALLLFGAINGIMDIAMNTHAVIVERESSKSKMSGFHGFYSFGSIFGAGSVSLLLWAGLSPLHAIYIIALFIAFLLLIAGGDLRTNRQRSFQPHKTPLNVLSHRGLLFIAWLCFIVFLTEGAMLDWSSLFLITQRGIDSSFAGAGFTLYAISMTLARLSGDGLIRNHGAFAVLASGGLIAAAGLLLVILVDNTWISFGGLILAGAGIANIVPILFTLAGNYKSVPPAHALPAVTLMGYMGLLTGPAMLGFIAHHTNLTFAFGLPIVFLLLVSMSAKRLTREYNFSK